MYLRGELMFKYWNYGKESESFGVILKTLRRAAGLTQTELAKRLNISRSSVSNYENGEREPSIDILKVISAYFSVPVDYLLGRNESLEENSEYDKKEDIHLILKRIDSKGNNIDIRGISLSKKLAIINYCEYIMSTDD